MSSRVHQLNWANTTTHTRSGPDAHIRLAIVNQSNKEISIRPSSIQMGPFPPCAGGARLSWLGSSHDV